VGVDYRDPRPSVQDELERWMGESDKNAEIYIYREYVYYYLIL